MKVKIVCVLALSFLSMVAGCSKNDFPDIPDVGIPIDQLNQDLRLVAFPTFNTFKIGESVNLELRLESDIEVEISPDSDTQIFALDTETKKWQKIQEVPDLGVFEPQTFILSLKDNSIKEISISLFPDLPLRSEPVNLLILVTGTVLQNEQSGNRKIGAYIIVKLRP